VSNLEESSEKGRFSTHLPVPYTHEYFLGACQAFRQVHGLIHATFHVCEALFVQKDKKEETRGDSICFVGIFGRGSFKSSGK
jgi:hypothetical protein